MGIHIGNCERYYYRLEESSLHSSEVLIACLKNSLMNFGIFPYGQPQWDYTLEIHHNVVLR